MKRYEIYADEMLEAEEYRELGTNAKKLSFYLCEEADDEIEKEKRSNGRAIMDLTAQIVEVKMKNEKIILQHEAEIAKKDEEIARLNECMRMAGLSAFIKDGKPEEIAKHLGNIAKSHLEYEERLRTLLREIWETIPSTFDGEEVGKHARTLNKIPEALERKEETKE